ncbi:MAG: hypothetical protein JXR49_22410 [Acidobacteria bacterium]|nr:hypothetical protein [Acidobacteriota bacterium]
MRSVYITALVLIIMVCSSLVPVLPASQAESEAEPTPEEIISKFTEKESEFFEAWMGYTYTQTAIIRVLSVDDAPVKNEAMMLVFEVVFNDDGTREVQLVERKGRVKSVVYTPEDEKIITDLNPFALTTKDLSLYNLKYQGKERVDELDCYVFEVDPESMKDNRIYFKGKIWVDDLDFQIVRTVGKAVQRDPGGQLYPEFETLRQVIDGKYWFPVWTHADETLRFKFPPKDARIEMTITYEGYKEFGSKTKIRFESQVPSDDSE